MFYLIVKEIWYRKFNFLLGLLAIITGIALFVFFFTMSEASKRETIRLTRDMGFNLTIIPRETDMNQFWIKGFSVHTFPEDVVFRIASRRDISYAHLTTMLHSRVIWRKKEVILTGILPEIEPSGKKKSPMIFTIQPGMVYVGYELASSFDLQMGDTIELFGKKFIVEAMLSESGSIDDIRLYANLRDVQELVNMKGRINEIKALNCLCLISGTEDPLDILRDQLTEVLPEAKVIMNRTIAIAREKQRMMIEKYFTFVFPVVVIVCAVWIGIFTMLNVKERQREIGVLRALGFSTGNIASLFFGRSTLLGILGAGFGFGIGTVLSLRFGPDIFKVTANMIKPMYRLLAWSLCAAPVFSALAAFIPVMTAITQDPSTTLREI